MASSRRANGTGSVHVKHGHYYGRYVTVAGMHANRVLGPVRLPGARDGLTRTQAERRLREIMDADGDAPVLATPETTIAIAGKAFVEQLEARGRAKSHVETAESHLRVHLVRFFGDRPIGGISAADVTRLLVELRRSGRAPKTIRNVFSTLHSIFELAVRRRWVAANPCKEVDPPEAPPSPDVRFLTQAELQAVLERGVPDDEWGDGGAAAGRAARAAVARSGPSREEGPGQAGLGPRRVQSTEVTPRVSRRAAG
jgi:integrase